MQKYGSLEEDRVITGVWHRLSEGKWVRGVPTGEEDQVGKESVIGSLDVLPLDRDQQAVLFELLHKILPDWV